MTVESSGPLPAPRRSKLKVLQAIARKREQTQDEARTEVLRRLGDRRAYWHAVIRQRVPGRYVEDVYGQVTVRISAYIAKTDPRTIKDIDAYIATTCVNCAIDQLRRSKSEAAVLIKVGIPPEGVSDTDEVVESEGYLLIRKVMAELLTNRQHLVYVLRHVKELNSREIGEALGIKPTLARKELEAAQKALAKEEVKRRLRSLLHEQL